MVELTKDLVSPIYGDLDIDVCMWIPDTVASGDGCAIQTITVFASNSHQLGSSVSDSEFYSEIAIFTNIYKIYLAYFEYICIDFRKFNMQYISRFSPNFPPSHGPW